MGFKKEIIDLEDRVNYWVEVSCDTILLKYKRASNIDTKE